MVAESLLTSTAASVTSSAVAFYVIYPHLSTLGSFTVYVQADDMGKDRGGEMIEADAW